MNTTDQGFSKEGLMGIALAILLLLINPEELVWRIILLATAGLLLLNVVRKSEWVSRSNPILTLSGESFADDDDPFWRKVKGYGLVTLGMLVFTFVTWPSKPVGFSGDVVILPGTATPQIQFHPTPKGILPDAPEVQPGPEKKQATGRAAGVPVQNVKPPAARPNPPGGLTAIVQ
jgi:hypothetical protein